MIIGQFRQHERLQRGNRIEQRNKPQSSDYYGTPNALRYIGEPYDPENEISYRIASHPDHHNIAIIQFTRHYRKQDHIGCNRKSRYKRQSSEYRESLIDSGSISQSSYDVCVYFHHRATRTENKSQSKDKQRLVLENQSQSLDYADFFFVLIRHYQSLFHLEQTQHESETYRRIDKSEITISHIFDPLFVEIGLYKISHEIHYGRRKTYHETDRSPDIGPLLLIGSDHSGEHIICILEQVPQYQRRDTGDVSVRYALPFLRILRLPCSQNGKYRKDRCKYENKRLIPSESRIGVLQQFAEKRLNDKPEHTCDKTYPRTVNDVEVVDRRYLRCRDQT